MIDENTEMIVSGQMDRLSFNRDSLSFSQFVGKSGD